MAGACLQAALEAQDRKDHAAALPLFQQALDDEPGNWVGYTGLGVVASRFGARVALDLLHGRDTELTRLELVRSRPIPFPPEPLRYAVIQATRISWAART